MTANEQLRICGSDVQAAFLQSDTIDREVYIQPPVESKKPGVIWKLLKPAYGLRDASRKWFESFTKTLKELGMRQCLRDACLFYYRKDNKMCGLLLFHVDDILSSGDESFNNDIISPLRKKYNFGTVNEKDFFFTGLHIYQNENHEIFLDQNQYIENMNVFKYSNL